MKALLFPLLVGVAIVGAASPVGAGGVVVIMAADVDEYRKALRGFKQTVRDDIIAEYDMEGDFKRGPKILDEIRSKTKPDLILAIGVWALEVVASHTMDVPVVYAMVVNPPSIVKAGANITGASMNVPVEQSILLFKQLSPQVRRVGMLYSPAKTGYLVRDAEAVAREHGIQLVAREVRSPKEAIPALETLQEGVDALWILPDETVLAPAVVQQMLLLSYRKKLPLLGLSEAQARMGALLSLSFASGEDIGRQAGDLANSILAGKAAAAVPYTTARQVKLTVNLKAAQKLGLAIPKSILDRANTIIQ
jgi:putative ABC transport system substrate-binding protein